MYRGSNWESRPGGAFGSPFAYYPGLNALGYRIPPSWGCSVRIRNKNEARLVNSWVQVPGDGLTPANVKLKIERLPDRTVMVSATVGTLGSDAVFLFLMNLYWLETQFSDQDKADP